METSGDFSGGGRFPITVFVLFKVATQYLVEGILAHLFVYKIFQDVPSAASGVEAAAQLGGDVAVIENLLIGGTRARAFRRAQHVALVASAARRFGLVLDAGGDVRIGFVRVCASGTAHIHAVPWRRYPQGAVVFRTETHRIVAGWLVAGPFDIRAVVPGNIQILVRAADQIVVLLLDVYCRHLCPGRNGRGRRRVLCLRSKGTAFPVEGLNLIVSLENDIGPIPIGALRLQVLELDAES